MTAKKRILPGVRKTESLLFCRINLGRNLYILSIEILMKSIYCETFSALIKLISARGTRKTKFKITRQKAL